MTGALARARAGVALAAFALGCAALPALGPTAPRVSDYAASGDDRFRASQRLVLEGLDADAAGAAARALGRYKDALQVDSNNPWVYLALARHHVEAGAAQQALAHVDRAQVLFESTDPPTPGAELHCDGLRGAALALLGRRAQSLALLDAAARGAPDVWSDASLSAAELR